MVHQPTANENADGACTYDGNPAGDWAPRFKQSTGFNGHRRRLKEHADRMKIRRNHGQLVRREVKPCPQGANRTIAKNLRRSAMIRETSSASSACAAADEWGACDPLPLLEGNACSNVFYDTEPFVTETLSLFDALDDVKQVGAAHADLTDSDNGSARSGGRRPVDA
jgi:hypothetical protein